MTLFLVRHGRPKVEPGVPAHEWDLDPGGYDDVRRLRDSGRLPGDAAWYSSPEPKAVQTARLLTDAEVAVVVGLREHRRDSGQWLPDFPDVVRRAFAEPDAPAAPGWEPLADCRARVVAAAEAVLTRPRSPDVVMVGHGTAWTVLAAALTATPPAVGRWAALTMPDVIEVPW